MGNLLVHGGTRLSGKVVGALVDAGINPHVTVTRESAKGLYPGGLVERVRVGRLTPRSLHALVDHESVSAILDVTHPFADRISRTAIDVSDERGLPYLYLDRESVLPDEHPLLELASDWLEASQQIKDSGTILLTIGVKRLEFFTKRLNPNRLVARVLPDKRSVGEAKRSGIPRRNIVAMWPPDTAGMEQQLLEEHNAGSLNTQKSGPPGNLPEKWEACRRTGTRMIAVERPDVEYPRRTLNADDAVEWGRKHAGS